MAEENYTVHRGVQIAFVASLQMRLSDTKWKTPAKAAASKPENKITQVRRS
jgi:hypothetical protein